MKSLACFVIVALVVTVPGFVAAHCAEAAPFVVHCQHGSENAVYVVAPVDGVVAGADVRPRTPHVGAVTWLPDGVVFVGVTGADPDVDAVAFAAGVAAGGYAHTSNGAPRGAAAAFTPRAWGAVVWHAPSADSNAPLVCAFTTPAAACVP